MDIQWALVKKDISELKEYEHNPRILTAEESIRKFGFAEPLIINTDNTICGGHGRKKTLEKLNITEVDCYVPSRELNSEEFDELNLRLNKNIAGKFDLDVLGNRFDLEELQDIGFSLRDLGMDTNMNFDPKLDPTYAKGYENEDSRFDPKENKTRQITCPSCYADFEVQND